MDIVERCAREGQRLTEQTNMGRRRAAAAQESTASYQEKRKAIVTAAARVFQKRGYEATSLAQIATEAGTDRATLYYYASSKQDLFDEVIRQASEKNLAAVEAIVASGASASEKLIEALSQLMESYSSDYPYLHVFMERYLQSLPAESGEARHQAQDWAARYYDAIRSILRQGQETGEFDFELPLGIITIGVIGTVNWIQATGVTSAKRRKALGDKALAPGAIGAGLSQLLLQGLLARQLG
jgi:TetR/AcrR family transcriptional regulator, cholesterol catabolism regulator